MVILAWIYLLVVAKWWLSNSYTPFTFTSWHSEVYCKQEPFCFLPPSLPSFIPPSIHCVDLWIIVFSNRLEFLIILMLTLFQVWPMGAPLSRLLFPCNKHPPLFQALSFCITSYSGFILFLLCHSLRISWQLLWHLESKIRIPGVLIALEYLCF